MGNKKGGLKPSETRFFCNPGLGFKIPNEAKNGNYDDKKCPFTGKISIRGRILTGIVWRKKMQGTIVVRRNFLHYIPKYQRYEKRHSNIPAHLSPCFECEKGDSVIIGQCRPLSRTVRFNVLRVIAFRSKSKKAFTHF